MTVTFIGHGYVGLVTAAVFADLGNTVYVIGHTPEKVENLKKGIIPIYEPGLEDLVKKNLDAGRLLFTLDYDEAIPASDVVFIAVGTPPQPDGSADLSVVFETAEKVGRYLDGYTVVTVKSTVPVGTNRRVAELISKVKPEKAEFDIASVPEFLREGQAISDTQHPDRVVIGTDTDRARETMVSLHRPLTVSEENSETNLVLTNIPSAEMIKYASNAFLATKISFANAIAQLSEKVGADGPSVLAAVGEDKRIGKAFLNAGAGYGGSCFPKDVKALIQIAKQNSYDFTLLEEVEHINKFAIDLMVHKAKNLLKSLDGKTIAVLGLSFKPDTDDMRDSPAITIIKKLVEGGAKVKAYDPIAMDNAKHILGTEHIHYTKDAYEAVDGADLMMLVTDWDEFIELDLGRVKGLLTEAHIIDGRNVYDPDTTRALGFTYTGVGR